MLAALTLALLAPDPAVLDAARLRGDEAHRALCASHAVLEGWLALQDPETRLIGQNVDRPLWSISNSAADLYPFLVLTSYFTDRTRYEGAMREILDEEIRRTTRLGSLSDDLDLTTDRFAQSFDIHRIMFGNAEYAKDGLLPLVERLGDTPWRARILEIARDLVRESPVTSDYGPLPASGAEVCGETLEVLCRLHSATGDPVLREGAWRIADAWFGEVLPGNGGMPCHEWDFTAHRARRDLLILNDHGNEIVGGLTEAWALARACDRERADRWEPALLTMLDTALARYRNARGILSQQPEGEGGVPDTWGYLYNAYYTVATILGREDYRQATLEAMEAATGYLEWGGADSYADCEESALILLAREWSPTVEEWLRRMLERHYAYQQPSGILEGWYGDGNSARTWLLWSLERSRGTWLEEWRPDLRLGAAPEGEGLLLSLRAEQPWEGRLHFDRARHREHLNLPTNYPRLNEWPEWWVAEPSSLYTLRSGEEERLVTGRALIEGLPLRLAAGEELVLGIQPAGRPPFGMEPPPLTAEQLAGLAEQAEVGAALDGLMLSGEVYLDTPYQWLGRGAIRATLETRGVREVTLALLWGAKGDSRSARIRLGGVETTLERGGWDGFSWVRVPLTLPEGTNGPVPLEIEAPEGARAAFLGAVLLAAGR